METGEGNHIDSKLTEITVELPRETEGASGTSDGIGNKVIQVTVTGVGELKSAEANVIERLVIKSKALVSVLHQLMHREGSIVRLDNGV
mmetsp:Transcript_637/g.966  ORF Transcript_637/g.966 Transcript_637/m.966 type:complete len:89 (-) Transcript_637:549-815(-)